MAKLPKVGQVVECDLPGYENAGIAITVWVNAPQSVFDEWEKLRQAAAVTDENGRPVYETNEDGSIQTDENYEPVRKIDQAKQMAASTHFLRSMVMDFTLTEDLDGNPLSLQDEDFMKRVPEDLIRWLYDSVMAAVEERRRVGKLSVRLAGTTSTQ